MTLRIWAVVFLTLALIVLIVDVRQRREAARWARWQAEAHAALVGASDALHKTWTVDAAGTQRFALRDNAGTPTSGLLVTPTNTNPPGAITVPLRVSPMETTVGARPTPESRIETALTSRTDDLLVWQPATPPTMIHSRLRVVTGATTLAQVNEDLTVEWFTADHDQVLRTIAIGFDQRWGGQ